MNSSGIRLIEIFCITVFAVLFIIPHPSFSETEKPKCIDEGGSIPVIPNAPSCCEGLILIRPKNPLLIGSQGICTDKCGNGTCDPETETVYNCPRDCTDPDDPFKYRIWNKYEYPADAPGWEGTDWHHGQIIIKEESPVYGIYLFRLMKKDKQLYVGWFDCFKEQECAVMKIHSLATVDFGKETTQIRITKARPKSRAEQTPFETHVKTIVDGKAGIGLWEIPVIVEAVPETSTRIRVLQASTSICEPGKKYKNTAVEPVPCKCPEGYEFNVVEMAWGPCPREGMHDCPASILKCVPEATTEKCSDGVCGRLEKTNPDICPEDCTEATVFSTRDLERGWYWGSLTQKKTGTPDDWVHSLEGTRSACWHRPNAQCGQTTSSQIHLPSKKCARLGEMCGGLAGILCCPGLECKLGGNYPDASGTCAK